MSFSIGIDVSKDHFDIASNLGSQTEPRRHCLYRMPGLVGPPFLVDPSPNRSAVFWTLAQMFDFDVHTHLGV